MSQRYDMLFKALDEYLRAFSENGFDAGGAESLAALIEQGGDTPLDNVIHVFGCGRFEAFALLTGAFVSADAKYGSLLARFGAEPSHITPAAVAAVFFGISDIIPFIGCLSESSPLARLFDGVCPDAAAQLSLKGSIACYIFTGELYDPLFDLSEDDTPEYIPLESEENASAELCSLLAGLDHAVPAVIRVCGEKGSGRHTAVRLGCSSAGQPYITLSLPTRVTDKELTELCTKLLLSGSVPVIAGRCSSAEIIDRIADELGLVIVLCESAGELRDLTSETFTVSLGMPSLEEQLRLWQSMCRRIMLDASADLTELTGEFDMTPGAIKKAVRCAELLSDKEHLTLSDIKNGCCRSSESDMGSRAVRISPVYNWDDIVLPAHSRQLLRAACDQVRLRHKVFDGWGFGRKMPYGKGVSMIFTGPPGTGKTMAAQIIAAELGMEIYRISLANVVSKYIGETEKNLDEIFDKAKRSRAILFFDEADALFSRRTEVKDSNDKYSNMEAAFLLQKTEEFSGVVILATNLVQNFDEAFKRRMRFIIDFPFPDAERCRELWKRAFPEKAPLADIDLDFLVERFELSGSNIRSIALHSAFLAASDGGSAIGMKHIMSAIRNEYAKSGKAFTRAEAGEYYYLLTEG